MTGSQLLEQRRLRKWEQMETAAKLKVSQPYLSLIESGRRPVTKKLARRIVRVFDLPPTALPLDEKNAAAASKNTDLFASQLAALGYAKFSHLTKTKQVNPAQVLVTALKADELESRLVEALPWLILNFPDLDWELVIKTAKLADAQNRLGFLVAVAGEKAEEANEMAKAQIFKELLTKLEKSRLFREDSFRRKTLTQAESKWLQENRPALAKYWRVLSNLTAEHI
jgi:transcriptional regulator with XRE-family HTH domain